MLPLIKYIKRPTILLFALVSRVNFLFPDRLYLKIIFRLHMGQWPNLKNPKTFNEKLQWLKLYDRNPEYTKMVDKYEVKKIVGNIIGNQHIIPTLGVWDRPEDIEWDRLPNQFVLKTTHGGGSCGVIICKDKESFDRDRAIKKLKLSLQYDIYKKYREWPYKNVRKRILAEEYMSDNGHELMDYKVHNFNGKPCFILLCRNRFGENEMTDDFYTTSWEHMDVKRPNKNNPGNIEKPAELDEMLDYAEKLSVNIPFVRSDFYIINRKVYFGELTFFPASGLSKFEPELFDSIFGKLLCFHC